MMTWDTTGRDEASNKNSQCSTSQDAAHAGALAATMVRAPASPTRPSLHALSLRVARVLALSAGLFQPPRALRDRVSPRYTRRDRCPWRRRWRGGRTRSRQRAHRCRRTPAMVRPSGLAPAGATAWPSWASSPLPFISDLASAAPRWACQHGKPRPQWCVTLVLCVPLPSSSSSNGSAVGVGSPVSPFRLQPLVALGSCPSRCRSLTYAG